MRVGSNVGLVDVFGRCAGVFDCIFGGRKQNVINVIKLQLHFGQWFGKLKIRDRDILWQRDRQTESEKQQIGTKMKTFLKKSFIFNLEHRLLTGQLEKCLTMLHLSVINSNITLSLSPSLSLTHS